MASLLSVGGAKCIKTIFKDKKNCLCVAIEGRSTTALTFQKQSLLASCPEPSSAHQRPAEHSIKPLVGIVKIRLRRLIFILFGKISNEMKGSRDLVRSRRAVEATHHRLRNGHHGIIKKIKLSQLNPQQPTVSIKSRGAFENPEQVIFLSFP